MSAVTVGTAMIAMSRQRTRQLLSDRRDFLRNGLPAVTSGGLDSRGRDGAARTGRPGSPAPPGPPKAPAPGPPCPGPTASGPPFGGPPPPFSGSPEAGACGPPFPLVIDRLRTALAPRSFTSHLELCRTSHLDLCRAANGGAAHHRHLPLPSLSNDRCCTGRQGGRGPSPASVTKRVWTYNHQLGGRDRAFTRNHPELCQRWAHPLRLRHRPMAVANPWNAGTPSIRHPARAHRTIRTRQREYPDPGRDSPPGRSTRAGRAVNPAAKGA